MTELTHAPPIHSLAQPHPLDPARLCLLAWSAFTSATHYKQSTTRLLTVPWLLRDHAARQQASPHRKAPQLTKTMLFGTAGRQQQELAAGADTRRAAALSRDHMCNLALTYAWPGPLRSEPGEGYETGTSRLNARERQLLHSISQARTADVEAEQELDPLPGLQKVSPF